MAIGNNLRVLRAKWWIVVVVAVLGAAAGMYVARSHNDSIRSTWRAEAPVTFIAFTEDEPSSSGSQSKSNNSTGSAIGAEAEGVRAQLLLEDTLRDNPKLSLRVDRENNMLFFTALGRDGDETLGAALELRNEYRGLSSDVLNKTQIDETISILLVDIEELQTKIDEIAVQEPPAEDASITSARAVLVEQIDTLNGRQTELRIWILSPELRPTADDYFGIVPEVVKEKDSSETTIPPEPEIIGKQELESELKENAIVLERLNVQLGLIPDEPVADELGTEAALELEALEAAQTDLQEQYVALLQVADGRSPGGFYDEPTIIDETAAVRPVGLFGLGGFLAGALLASIALVAIDKARKTVWDGDSLEDVALLGMVDRNRSDGLPKDIWYPTSRSQRRRDIQTFRATIDAITQEQPAIVGFFGVRMPGEEVGELAADLATAYTVAGRDVLLIDTNAYEPNTLAEYGTQSSSLTRILVSDLSVDDAVTAIGGLIDATPQVIPHLTSLHVDAATHDPIDAIASPNSRSLMEVARERFDIVIVAGPAIADPLSDTVARRLDFAVLTGQSGRTTLPQLISATTVLTDRRTVSPGVVLLHGRRKALFGSVARLFRSRKRGGAWRAAARRSSDKRNAQPERPWSEPAPASAPAGVSEELDSPGVKAESN